MWKRILIAVVIGWGSYHWWTTRPVAHAPGVLTAQVPLQSGTSDDKSFEFKEYRVTPLARFSIEARVLRREDYSLGREADLSPTDLALGWGPMSDETVLGKISISQSNRFYYWRVEEFPIPQREIETHSANMHMIPADNTVERQLKKVRQGQVIKLRGQLVRVDAKDGWRWVSSLTRDDTGAGACELIWVEELTAL